MDNFHRIDTTANRLRKAMEEAGKRPVDVSNGTGIDKGSLSHYMKGTYEPKQDAVYKLAKFLGVSEMWLGGYDCKRERTDEQLKNDALSDIIVRLRTDSDFWLVVKALDELEAEQFATIKQLLTTFKK